MLTGSDSGLLLALLALAGNGCEVDGGGQAGDAGRTEDGGAGEGDVGGGGGGDVGAADAGTGEPQVLPGLYGVQWLPLPGGRLSMGRADLPATSPVHQVTLAPFFASRSEVTVGQYRRCIEAGACARPGEGTLAADDGDEARADLPVERISWFGANSFCAAAGGSLPSEAQWEYAARAAGTTAAYPWGAAAPDCQRAVFASGGPGCGRGGVAAVCSRPRGRSPQGVCDLLGNADEWLADCWHGSYDGAPTDGTAWSGVCFSRVLRGGSYRDVAASLDARLRAAEDPDYAGAGFRCVRSR